ncbi:MAG: glycosyltransferase family 39 protein [Flavipsychrobacter sp.]|nr:glycosyltransferase family 39 protein [Flavipsychrobacter sp.]
MSNFLRPTLYKDPVFPYDFKNWTINNIWLHKQPLALWLIACSLKLFGIHAWAVRVPSVIASTIGIKLIYDIAKQLYNRQVAFIAAFLFSIHGFIMELASGRTASDHIDVVFLFFIITAVWLAVKYLQRQTIIYTLLIGCSLGAALLTKWLPALIVLPVYTLLMFFNKERLGKISFNVLIIFCAAMVVFLPWQWYILHTYPTEAVWEYATNSRHFYQAIEGHSGSWLYHFGQLRFLYSQLVYIPIAWFTYHTYINRNKTGLVICTWFWIPYLFFSLSATKMPAYTLIASPAIFIITAVTFYQFKAYYSTKTTPLYRWLVIGIAYALLLLPVCNTLEALKPFETSEKDIAYMQTIHRIINSGINNDSTIVLNSSHPIEIMFYTNCLAYQYQQDTTAIRALQQQGYHFYFVADDNIKKWH